MSRLGHRMDHGEEALGQLVGLALSHLVGLDRHQGVVAPFGLHGHRDPADGAGELPAPGLLLHRAQSPVEITTRPGQDLVGGEVGAVEVFHAIELYASWEYSRSVWVICVSPIRYRSVFLNLVC